MLKNKQLMVLLLGSKDGKWMKGINLVAPLLVVFVIEKNNRTTNTHKIRYQFSYK